MSKPLSFFNTLSGKLEVFEPLKAGVASMYSCGPTVYDHAHIGNMRPYVHADIAKRALEHAGFVVTHTINVTDFGHLVGDGDAGEDKMMLALRRENKPITKEAMGEMTRFYTESFKTDLKLMNVEPNITYAPASKYIQEEIALVQALSEKGYTYETSDGVYFDISRFPAYGKLGNIDLDTLKNGARVEVNPEKRHPADFAVWKRGELGWESPWGTGFPGWHIECTAMAFATLGKQIDVHTGGEDLASTHHNGEIAQAECATSRSPYVKYWMHNAFITIENSKISKSLGNTLRLEHLKERGYSAIDFRYWLMSGHYRTTMNFTFDALDGAHQALFRLRRHMFEDYAAEEGGRIAISYSKAFWNAINDDLNTPAGLAVVWKLVDDTQVSAKDKVATLRSFDELLGLDLSLTKEKGMRMLGVVSVNDVPSDIKKLLDEREHAREVKDWERADVLRAALNMKGYLVEDSAKGIRITKI